MKVDRRLVASCISGHIYDSDPIDFTTDLGARFALRPSIIKIPGATRLASFLAKGVTSSLDGLFLTRFGSQRAEFWEALYSSVVSYLLYWGFSSISLIFLVFTLLSYSCSACSIWGRPFSFYAQKMKTWFPFQPYVPSQNIWWVRAVM